MANIASAMFGGNVTKLLVSMDREGEYVIDLEDLAVRSMLVSNAGELLEPYVPPPPGAFPYNRYCAHTNCR